MCSLSVHPEGRAASKLLTPRVVCAGEVEYRNLSEKELALCTRAAMPAGLKLKEADADLVEALHKKGLLYLEVPIRPDDHVSIPPLEVRPPHIVVLLRPAHQARCRLSILRLTESSMDGWCMLAGICAAHNANTKPGCGGPQ